MTVALRVFESQNIKVVLRQGQGTAELCSSKIARSLSGPDKFYEQSMLMPPHQMAPQCPGVFVPAQSAQRFVQTGAPLSYVAAMRMTPGPWQSSGGLQQVRVVAKPQPVVQVHLNASYATCPVPRFHGFAQTTMVNVAPMATARKPGVEVLEPCDFAAAKLAEGLVDLHLKPVEHA